MFESDSRVYFKKFQEITREKVKLENINLKLGYILKDPKVLCKVKQWADLVEYLNNEVLKRRQGPNFESKLKEKKALESEFEDMRKSKNQQQTQFTALKVENRKLQRTVKTLIRKKKLSINLLQKERSFLSINESLD